MTTNEQWLEAVTKTCLAYEEYLLNCHENTFDAKRALGVKPVCLFCKLAQSVIRRGYCKECLWYRYEGIFCTTEADLPAYVKPSKAECEKHIKRLLAWESSLKREMGLLID